MIYISIYVKDDLFLIFNSQEQLPDNEVFNFFNCVLYCLFIYFLQFLVCYQAFLSFAAKILSFFVSKFSALVELFDFLLFSSFSSHNSRIISKVRYKVEVSSSSSNSTACRWFLMVCLRM